MRTRIAALVTLVLAAGAALAAGPVAAATPGYCRGDAPIDVDHLPAQVDLDRCDIEGRVVVKDGLRTVVPPPGQGRTLHAVRTTGEVELDVRTTPDGTVMISSSLEQITAEAAASNDQLGSAEVVQTPTAFSWFRDGTTVDATVEGKDAEVDASCMTPADTAPDRTVWYRYVAGHHGQVKVRLANVNPVGSVISAQVFQGDGLHPMRCTNEQIWLTKGKAYYIRVGSRGAPASFRLQWFPPVPPNDSFGKAPVLSMPSNAYATKMTGATLQPGEPVPSCKTTWTGTVWHKVQSGTLRRLAISTGGGGFALYRGTSLSGLKQVACSNSTWKEIVTNVSGPFYVQQWVKPGVESTSLSVYSGEAYPEMPAPCSKEESQSYSVLWGVDGRKPLNWRFNSANVPASLGSSALPLIKQGIGIVTASKNDCGLADHVSAQQSYLGATTRPAGLCGTAPPDGLNVVDFGTLDYNTLGIACSMDESTDGVNWYIAETDIRLSKQTAWTLKPDAPGCWGKYDLVGVVAHEAGHAFALDHPYGQGNQTMSAVSMDCTTAYRTLGRGDVLGLRSLY